MALIATEHDDITAARFGAHADEYVASAVHAEGVDLSRLAALAARLGPAHALDVGSGGGHVSYALAPHCGRVTAIDLSQGMLAAVASEARRRGLATVHTQCGTAEALPFEDESYDLVASRFSAHHWLNWEAGLREMARVAVPNGTVFLADVLAPVGAAADTHLQAIELIRDPSHVRDRSLSEWVSAVERTGLSVLEATSHPLRLEFRSWVRRMSTPPDRVAVLLDLQRGASAQVREALRIEEDGSFTCDVGVIVTERTAGKGGSHA